MSPRPAEGIAPSAATRRRLGLVLSGGGSRGLAHIGVLRALAEAGIAVDCLAGVSAGALVGALHAAGHPPAEMVEFFRETHPFRSRNVAFARPGIWDTQKYVPALQRYFPDDRFEALRCGLRVLTTDLIAGEARVFESGTLIGPLLASSAVPLVFSPMEIDGRWYGDGGIIDNFPVGLLEGRCDVILGVHVNPLREIGLDDLSSSFSVLERALDVGMYAQSRENFRRCDVVIQPQELISYGLFDTKHFVEIEQAGYTEAVRRMPEIRQLLGGSL